MIKVLADACRGLMAESDFWLLSVLGDWTFEETNRPCFKRYVKSWEGRVPDVVLCKVKQGINDLLKNAIEDTHGLELQIRRNECYPGSRERSDLAIVGRNGGQTVHVEVKYVYDCTYPKQYKYAIPADSRKPLDYQIVFFAGLPYYHYPSAICYGVKRAKCRQTVIVGIERQYAELCRFIRPADWPKEAPWRIDLPLETPTISEDCIRAWFNDAAVFWPDEPWEFVASRELKDAQVGFAIWDWSRTGTG
ncbi:MAG TPA: hypothetical protein VJL29_05470 [Thermoguttaceae bacterium]|nr:hypothetical protein [Thermoguttaceae bacterium]